MNAKSLVTATLLLLASTMIVTPVSADDDCQDDDPWYSTTHDLYCGFSCSEGDTVNVAVNGPTDAWGSAECHNASAGCQVVADGRCQGYGLPTDTATSSGDGECRGNANDGDIICTSGAGPHYSVLAMLRQVIQSGATCEGASAFAAGSGIHAFTYKEFSGGALVSVKAWDGRIGCLPE
jgi:hypothetical protein